MLGHVTLADAARAKHKVTRIVQMGRFLILLRREEQGLMLRRETSPFRRLLTVLCSALACLSVATAAGAADAPYVFTLNGAPFEPTTIRLTDGEGLAPGDLFEVDGLWMVLGDERRLDLFSQPDGVQFSRPDGTRAWIGLRLPEAWQRDRVDHLRTLSAADIALLRGLKTERWTASCQRAAKWLDWARLHLSLGQTASTGQEGLPALDRRLRSMEVNRLTSLRGLSRLEALVSLEVFPEKEFDAGALERMARLRRFIFYGRRLVGVQTLGKLPELEILRLDPWETPIDMAFAWRLPRLRDFSGRGVGDLRPLSAGRDLERIEAGSRALRFLPLVSFPRLKLLDILGSSVDESEVRRFRETNPAAEVRYRWEEGFAEVIRAVDNVRLIDAAGCGAPPSGPTVIVRDPGDVAAFVRLVAFDKNGRGGICGCLSSTWIELFQQDRRLARLGVACDSQLQWEEWGVWADLTAGSIDTLSKWLAQHGAPSLKKSIELREQRGVEEDAKRARRLAGLDPRIVEALAKEDGRDIPVDKEAATGPLAKALKAVFPVARDQIRTLFQVLGPGAGESGYGAQEYAALEILKSYSGTEVVSAARLVVNNAETEAMLGAARFFWQTGIPAQAGSDPAFRDPLLNLLQSKAATRRMVDSFLRTWWNHLSVQDRANHVGKLIEDSNKRIRHEALLTAGQFGGDWADSMLIQQLSKAPTADASDPDASDPGLSDGEVAALALGYRNSAEARTALDGVADAPRGVRVARAMTGERCSLLEESDFRTKDNVATLQLAAVEAVARCRGAHALRWALSYDQAQYGWEEEQVVNTLRSMLLDVGAQGADALRAAKSLSQLRGWFATHGEGYLARFAR